MIQQEFGIWQLPGDISCKAAPSPRFARTIGVSAIDEARAQTTTTEPVWRHALSTFGEFKYPADFKRFDYVNPDAPKGGTVRLLELGTFDNFNMVVEGLKGSLAGGVGLMIQSLTTRALDEPSTAYGLLAESAAYPDDFSYVIYRLRAAARWHDGKPVTPEDVAFSFEALKKNSPMYSTYYRQITKCEKAGDHDVKFTFESAGNRELPMIAGEIPVFPKHWWEGTDAQGKKRDISATTLEIPLGSAAYRIKEFVAARSVVLERVADYWGKDIPTAIGQDNFGPDPLRILSRRHRRPGGLQGRSAGLACGAQRQAMGGGLRLPRRSRQTRDQGKIPDLSSGRMQGFAFNLRRPLFTDIRVRRAFNYAYDWEESDRQLSTGEYHRDGSFFDGIPELMSSGLPEGQELQILEAVRDKVPAEVFTTPYKNPVGGNPEAARNNLRAATRLLKDAGFEVRDAKLVDSKGQLVSVEFLCQDPGEERAVLFYKPSLERLGITVTIRTVDSVQYQNRVRSFDFDIVTALWVQSLSPGNEERDYFGSQSADRPGARNLPGIKNPAVDALIERIIFAKDRAELAASCKAFDRVLLWNCYLVPQFTYGFQRYARWDRFSHPEPLPKYGTSGFPSLWWWDAEKAAKTGGRS